MAGKYQSIPTVDADDVAVIASQQAALDEGRQPRRPAAPQVVYTSAPPPVYYGTWREPAPVVSYVRDDAFDLYCSLLLIFFFLFMFFFFIILVAYEYRYQYLYFTKAISTHVVNLHSRLYSIQPLQLTHFKFAFFSLKKSFHLHHSDDDYY